MRCSPHRILPAGRDCRISGVSSGQSCAGCRRAQVRVLLPALRVTEVAVLVAVLLFLHHSPAGKKLALIQSKRQKIPA